MLKTLFTVLALSLSVLVLAISISKNRCTHELSSGFEVWAMEGEAPSDYVMPYPGVLPDSPLYMLKMMRDRIREILTIAPADQVMLFNLYADKRVGAMEVLMNSGKTELAIETGNKGALYQQKAIGALEVVKARGGDVGKGGNVLERAIRKHIEMVTDMQQENDDAQLSGIAESMEKNYAAVKKVLGR